MRKKHNVISGNKYGKYTAVKSLMYKTKGGLIEKKWLCTDKNGEIHYFRARQLTCMIPMSIQI